MLNTSVYVEAYIGPDGEGIPFCIMGPGRYGDRWTRPFTNCLRSTRRQTARSSTAT